VPGVVVEVPWVVVEVPGSGQAAPLCDRIRMCGAQEEDVGGRGCMAGFRDRRTARPKVGDRIVLSSRARRALLASSGSRRSAPPPPTRLEARTAGRTRRGGKPDPLTHGLLYILRAASAAARGACSTRRVRRSPVAGRIWGGLSNQVGSPGCPIVEGTWWNHARRPRGGNHGRVACYPDGHLATTNTAEGYFANLKRQLHGTHHHTSKKHTDAPPSQRPTPEGTADTDPPTEGR